MLYEFETGLRYTLAGRKAGRRNGFISFIAALSAASIALGVAALITVLSVMNGFQKEVRDRMLSVFPHVEVFHVAGAMRDWRGVLNQLKQDPEVMAGAPFVAGQAMVAREEAFNGALVRGIEPSLEPQVTDFAKQLRRGSLESLKAGEFGVVIGVDLASSLGVGVGDKITLVTPQGTFMPTGFVPSFKRFTIVGIFQSGHSEYDHNLVLLHYEDAAKLFRVEGVSGVRLRTRDMLRAPEIAERLAPTLGSEYYLRDWTRENQTWFAAVKLEKRMMFIILTLIIAVAAFNLVSMLVMTVTDKRADIAILRTLGATPRSIGRIFMVQGAMIGWLGTLVGVVGGVLLALNIGAIVQFFERLFGFRVLPPGIYLINSLPSDLRWPDVVTIAVVAFILCLLATIYPSWRASRMEPAEALRYE